MKHDQHYFINTNQSTQEDTLTATVAILEQKITNVDPRFILVN